VASEPVDGGVDVASEPVDGGVEVAPEPVDAPDLIPLDEVRIRLGTAKNSNYKLHWEYGNSDLNNKHLLIQGKSGTGKTYLMQCLIQEMSCQKIPTLIIDYSNAFTLNELEEEFKESIGDNLENHFVYTDKFPLNPFRRQQIDLGGIMVDENDIDIAGRFKSVLNEVYNFGDQQLNCINNAILSGLKHYGSKMSLDLFRKELENDDSTHAETALNKLNEFLLHEPFNTKQNFEWTDLDERNGKVIIVQLAALPPSVQRIITELILWDLWFYKKNVTKSKEKPFNVVLDEAQNLNFKDSSPAYKILKEGRKFGWSAWFATQSFTGSMGSKEIDTLNNAEEKIFFKPTGDTSSIAKIISNSNSEQQEWKEKIQLLKKSECIVYGGIKDRNNNLTPSKPIIIKVDPLSSRINEN
jgi:DNA phosphorothioation-dependent restriction protein DptH